MTSKHVRIIMPFKGVTKQAKIHEDKIYMWVNDAIKTHKISPMHTTHFTKGVLHADGKKWSETILKVNGKPEMFIHVEI
jgi:hypothetical protein